MRHGTTPELDPARLSQAVIVALSEAREPMTIRDIEHAVGRLLAQPGPQPVESEVHALEGLDVLKRSDKRLFELTPRGQELADGIAILARA